MTSISEEELKAMFDREESFHLIEVLGPEEFANFHLPGAVNIPLNHRFEEAMLVQVPDRKDKVVLYCKDAACSVSQTAAQKLEEIGYRNVFDLHEGKEGWRDKGYPIAA